KKKTFKKKEKKVVSNGLVHVQASFNNTIVTFTDLVGNVLAWSSSGSLGFRGSRKGTPFAAQQASLTAANKAKEYGLRSVEVRVSGPGAGRESAVRALATVGIEVKSIKDRTPIPHNGCRPPNAGEFDLVEEVSRTKAPSFEERRKLHLKSSAASGERLKRTAGLSVVREKKIDGKIQWPRLPAVPARGHEAIPQRGALSHREVRDRKAQLRSRTARQGSQTEAGGLR